ncbi:MAG: hypothetical protein JWP44_2673 [Mucilaginibacter sp.]|nr:hypothetical protein [Mucilaginibacter sp.]
MERKYLFGIEDDGRTAGMVSYFFVIGWSIGYFGFHQPNKTSLSAYHLRQTLFLYLIYVAIWFGLSLAPPSVIQHSGIFSVYILKILITIIFVVLWVIGLTGAANGEQKPIPLVGNVAQKIFSSI